MTNKAIAYYRVSTAGQARSGLGLQAQKEAVHQLVEQRGMYLLAEYIEVESGKRDDRPNLIAALQHAKLTGAVLVIAKLDRLSRNAAFLLALRNSGVRFQAADLPDANDLTIGILALVAQAERESTSQRTKEALAAVKANIARNGSHRSRSANSITRLGNPNGALQMRAKGLGNEAASKAKSRKADKRARELAPIIRTLREGGSSPSAIARAMNENGYLTARAKAWRTSTVRALLNRLEAMGDGGESSARTPPAPSS